jgi:hypothetical protein
MRPQTETPPPDPSTDGDPSLLDQRRDEAAWHDEQPRDAVAGDVRHGEVRKVGLGDIYRGYETGTTHDDDQPAAFEDSA